MVTKYHDNQLNYEPLLNPVQYWSTHIKIYLTTWHWAIHKMITFPEFNFVQYKCKKTFHFRTRTNNVSLVTSAIIIVDIPFRHITLNSSYSSHDVLVSIRSPCTLPNCILIVIVILPSLHAYVSFIRKKLRGKRNVNCN